MDSLQQQIIEANIQACRKAILINAKLQGLDFKEEDIIAVDDRQLGTIIFLQKYNPEPILKDGKPMVDRSGMPAMSYSCPIWAEHPQRMLTFDASQPDIPLYRYNTVKLRLVLAAPSLVRIVEPNGNVLSHPDCIRLALDRIVLR